MSAVTDAENPAMRRHRTNAAKRLHDCLVKLKGATGNAAAYVTIPATLGITEGEDMRQLGWDCVAALSLVHKMLEDFTLEVDSSQLTNEERDYYLDCKRGVAGALSLVRITHPWDQYKIGIQDTLIVHLRSADVMLRRSVMEEMLAQADLSALREVIAEALSTVKNSNLPPELTSTIALHLIHIRTALDQYEYRGLLGLQEALVGYYGTIESNQQIITVSAPEAKSDLAKVLTTANSAIALAKGTEWVWHHVIAAGHWLATQLLASNAQSS